MKTHWCPICNAFVTGKVVRGGFWNTPTLVCRQFGHVLSTDKEVVQESLRASHA